MRILLLIALAVLVPPAIAAEPAAKARPSPPAGAERVEEPVFNGHTYVYQAGKEHKRTVVLVHGLGDAGAADWDAVVPALAQDFHVLRFDLPGFGHASKGNVLYSPENYVAFIKYITGKYARRPFYLVGHSLGGAVSLRYAATYPDDVERLAIVSAPALLHRFSYTQFLSHLGLDWLPSLYPGQKRHLQNLVTSVLARVEKMRIEPEVMLGSAESREKYLGADPTKIAGLALAIDDFSPFIQKVRVPTLLLWGAKDPIAPLRTGKALAAMLPAAELKIFSESQHTPMEDDAAGFNRVLLAYLHDGLTPPRALPVAAAAESPRVFRCYKKRGMVLTGDFERLTIERCVDTVVRNARIHTLRILNNSTVEIENSHVGAGGIHIDDARVNITGGSIEAPVAITTRDAHLDMAGVKINAPEGAVLATEPSSVVFSFSQLTSRYTQGMMHGYRQVTQKNPL